jgi:hypothetical protein
MRVGEIKRIAVCVVKKFDGKLIYWEALIWVEYNGIERSKWISYIIILEW